MARKRTSVSPHKRILSFLSSCLSLSFLSFFSTLLHDACGGCRRGCCWLLAAGCCRCCRPTENWWLERKKKQTCGWKFQISAANAAERAAGARPAREWWAVFISPHHACGGCCCCCWLAAAAAELLLLPNELRVSSHFSLSLSFLSLFSLSLIVSLSFLRCCMMRAADGLEWR